VVITGDHLTDSTAVKFGANSAPSFTIDSNTQITATAPPGAAGPVDLTVVGPGGTSATAPGLEYTYVTPAATVSPGSIDFTSSRVGTTTAFRSVTVMNSGSLPLTIGVDKVDSGDTSDFRTFADSCTGRQLATGQSCMIAVSFTPIVAGVRGSALVIGDDAGDGPHFVTLTGTGVPASADQPAALVQVPSNAFRLGKLGKLKLPVTVNAKGTVKVSGRGLGTVTAKGGPGTITVTLKPTSAGARTLKKKHVLKVKATVVFTPSGGRPASKKVTLKLKR
jgi:hypothetical protein